MSLSKDCVVSFYLMVFLNTNFEVDRLLNHPTVLVWLD